MIIITTILALIFSCQSPQDDLGFKYANKRFHYDSIPSCYLKIDSLRFVELLTSDTIFDFNVESNDFIYVNKNYELIDSFQHSQNCYYLILKILNIPDFELESRALILLLRDKNEKTIGTIKLAEYSEILLTTTFTNYTTSEFVNDSLLKTTEISEYCTDIWPIECWKSITNSQWVITSREIKLIESKSTREEI